MSKYTPDRWVIVEVTSKEFGVVKRILAGWYGGYLNGDSWRMSSGITEITNHMDSFEIKNESGSVYTCHKHVHGMSVLMRSIYASMTKELGAVDGASIKILEDV